MGFSLVEADVLRGFSLVEAVVVACELIALHHMGSDFHQGSNPHSLHWKVGFLTTRPPQKSWLNHFEYLILLNRQAGREIKVFCRVQNSGYQEEISCYHTIGARGLGTDNCIHWESYSYYKPCDRSYCKTAAILYKRICLFYGNRTWLYCWQKAENDKYKINFWISQRGTSPCGPVAKTLCFQGSGACSIPGQRTKIPCIAQHSQK